MGTGFWIILGLLAVLLLASSGKQKKNAGGGSAGAEKTDKRIDHLHYIDQDEYECPKCGARFRKNIMVCPKCGARFSGRVENMAEYDDELEEELEMEEWEEEN